MMWLAIDTAGSGCSVCVWRDAPLSLRASDAPRAHARSALTLVDEALADAGVELAAVDRLVIGEGPGALTGLRVAASVVQGFALVTGARIVTVSNLAALASRTAQEDAGRVVAAHDLGMGAVVWQSFDAERPGRVRALGAAALAEPDAVVWPDGAAVLVGSGAPLLAPPSRVKVRPDVAADAGDLAAVAAAGGGNEVALAAAQPRYWRHPVYN